jgi:hypothetical protein
MIDIVDWFHYLIGFLIVGFLIWLLVQIHNYFSKDNVPLEILINQYRTDLHPFKLKNE